MKQFVVDELRRADYNTLKTYLNDNFRDAAIDRIYWLPIATQVLSDIQINHKDCQPFYFVIDLEFDRMSIELLVRTKNRVQCACMAYATEKQCIWLIRQVDKMFEQLEMTS